VLAFFLLSGKSYWFEKSMSACVVLESDDLASLVTEHLDHTSIVALGRVSQGVRSALRSAIRGSPHLLARAARNAGALTKTQLMGLFALTSAEADALPRSQYVRLRGPGFYYLYRGAAFEHALAVLVSVNEWEARLRARAAADTLHGGAVREKRSSAWHQPRARVARCR